MKSIFNEKKKDEMLKLCKYFDIAYIVCMNCLMVAIFFILFSKSPCILAQYQYLDRQKLKTISLSYRKSEGFGYIFVFLNLETNFINERNESILTMFQRRLKALVSDYSISSWYLLRRLYILN